MLSDTDSDGRTAPPRSALVRKQGEVEVQTYKAQSPMPRFLWTRLGGGARAHTHLVPPPLSLSPVLSPHGESKANLQVQAVSL